MLFDLDGVSRLARALHAPSKDTTTEYAYVYGNTRSIVYL